MNQPTRWQYHVIWTPAPDKSDIRLVAVRQDGVLHTWDQYLTDGQVGIPTYDDVLMELWRASLELQERRATSDD